MTQVFLLVKVFFNDRAQLYLIIQTLYYALKSLGDTQRVVSCKSKGLSPKEITTSTTTGNSLSPSINWYGDSSSSLSFNESCLKQKTYLLLLENVGECIKIQ